MPHTFPWWIGFTVGLLNTGIGSSVSVGLIPEGLGHKLAVVIMAILTWVAWYAKTPAPAIAD